MWEKVSRSNENCKLRTPNPKLDKRNPALVQPAGSDPRYVSRTKAPSPTPYIEDKYTNDKTTPLPAKSSALEIPNDEMPTRLRICNNNNFLKVKINLF